MPHPNPPLASDEAGSPPPILAHELHDALARAAAVAAASGVDSEQFMQAAWAAFLDARPGLREELAQRQLEAQLAVLRARGQLAKA